MPSFFDGAEELRRALDESFDDAYTPRFAWQYFNVPELYCYLRARPASLLPPSLLARFVERLESWVLENMGLAPVAEPMLHLMVNGCSLSLHSDFQNGTFGYLWSLTRWDRRTFSGGETLLLHDGVPNYKRHHAHGAALYELVPPHFNQLVVFDDRIVHAVQVVQGGMDPKEARTGFVGHLRPRSPHVQGELSPEAVRRVLLELLARVADATKAYRDVQGTMTYRLEIAADGSVESVRVLTNALVTATAGYGANEVVPSVKAELLELVSALEFPAASSSSSVIFAVVLPVPSLEPIRLDLPHRLPEDEARRRTAEALRSPDLRLESLEGAPGEHLLRAPVAGAVRVDAQTVSVALEPPMWVPSQRSRFESELSAALTQAMAQEPR